MQSRQISNFKRMSIYLSLSKLLSDTTDHTSYTEPETLSRISHVAQNTCSLKFSVTSGCSKMFILESKMCLECCLSGDIFSASPSILKLGENQLLSALR